MKMTRLLPVAAIVAVLGLLAACQKKGFTVEGNITAAKDSVLYLEHMSLNGPVKTDSVKLGEDGRFAFSGEAATSPEFYRLRIADQLVNIAVDSTEHITVKAQYPDMSAGYTVEGSEECVKMKELVLKQMNLQTTLNAIAANPALSVAQVTDSIAASLNAYKDEVKRNYIFKEPMKAYAYFALFQTVNLGGAPVLIFNPRNSEDDVKVFAAVATSWDTYFPNEERGTNLHNIAIEGMKNVRIIKARQQVPEVDPKVIDQSGIVNITLTDNHGNLRSLASLKGKVVLLDFHLFAAKESVKRIMMLRELYNKYHSRGLEIYQVSVDPNEHFWKTQTASLPWISVRDDAGAQSANLARYNVQQIPTYFLLDKNVNPYKRDVQITNIEKEIEALL